ncbi:MAG: flavoprotein [Candidatus Thorarchaeota archaeon]
MKKRVLVCLTGASGAIYGVRLLRALKSNGHEVHLIVSKWGEETLKYETGTQRPSRMKLTSSTMNRT